MNVEGENFWKKLVDNCNKRGVEGGEKSKSISVSPRLLETRIDENTLMWLKISQKKKCFLCSQTFKLKSS